VADASLWATLISTCGAICAGAGGITITHWGAIRREAAQADRRQREERADARRKACSDLLAAAARLRVQVEIACQRQWRDMNARIADIQQCATDVSLCASQVALLGGTELPGTARSFANAASALTAAMIKNTKMGGPQVLDVSNESGYVEPSPSFMEFDSRLEHLYEVIRTEIGGY
jgi:hypothetical protein